jgi:hypothetical protein
MANFDTNLLRKGNRERGVYAGQEQSLTGVLRVEDGGSIATTDLIRAVPLGENVRPIKLVVSAIPVSGTPVLTNPTFDIGVAPLETVNFKRGDETEYPPLTADVDALAAAVALTTDSMQTVIEVTRPVADSVSAYGPYIATLTPSGAGAFSVAGGAIDLQLTVVFLAEQKADGFAYEEYHSTKVSN